MAENNNRWWEFYLTRYLAANMFAVMVLFYLVAFHGNEIRDSLCKHNPKLESYKTNLCNKPDFFLLKFLILFFKQLKMLNL